MLETFCLLFLKAIEVVSIENPRQTGGNTVAYVAREGPVSDFEGVLNTVRNCVATVK